MAFERYYDTEWVHRHAYFAHHRLRFLQTWDATAELGLAPGRVLDVGGGVGPIAAYLARLGWRAEGTSADLRGALPIPTASFDLILCTEVIEHIKDVESTELHDLEAFNYSGVINMLNELRRALRPEGLLLITTPNAASWHMLAKWLYGELPLADPNHVREFTVPELTRVASLSNLRPIWLKTIDSWGQGGFALRPVVASLLSDDRTLPVVDRGDNIVSLFTPN